MHQDYILRTIQQMAVFITRVLRLRKDGEPELAIVELTHAYSRLAGLPASLVHGLTEEDLIALLGAQGRLNADRCLTLAELLREEGHAYDDLQQPDEAYPRYLKAMRLYLEALLDVDDLRGHDLPGLDDTIERLHGDDLSAGTRKLLLPYLEETGQFDTAENILVHWWEATASDEAGTALDRFYVRLLARTDAELLVGGLTRDEVKDGQRWIRDALNDKTPVIGGSDRRPLPESGSAPDR